MANFEPQNLNLNILYDDFDIIMVNKPPFMVVHPTKSHFDNTIANGITYYIKEKNEKVKVRFVNRLDMNTSGLVIVAKNAYCLLYTSNECIPIIALEKCSNLIVKIAQKYAQR